MPVPEEVDAEADDVVVVGAETVLVPANVPSMVTLWADEDASLVPVDISVAGRIRAGL